jgi:hypothetical protein
VRFEGLLFFAEPMMEQIADYRLIASAGAKLLQPLRFQVDSTEEAR